MSLNNVNQPLNTNLLISAALITVVGGLLTGLGLTLGSAAVIGAGRRWQQRTEMTPAELAKHAFGAARTATTAGVGAWRGPMPVGAVRASADGAATPVS